MGRIKAPTSGGRNLHSTYALGGVRTSHDIDDLFLLSDHNQPKLEKHLDAFVRKPDITHNILQYYRDRPNRDVQEFIDLLKEALSSSFTSLDVTTVSRLSEIAESLERTWTELGSMSSAASKGRVYVNGWTDVWEGGSYGQQCMKERLEDTALEKGGRFAQMNKYQQLAVMAYLYTEGLKWRPRRFHVHDRNNLCDDLCLDSSTDSIWLGVPCSTGAADIIESMRSRTVNLAGQRYMMNSWRILIFDLWQHQRSWPDLKKDLTLLLSDNDIVDNIKKLPIDFVRVILNIFLKASDHVDHADFVRVSSGVEDSVSKLCSSAVRKIYHDTGILPPALFLKDVIQTSDRAVAGGAGSDVYRVTVKGADVALKSFRELEFSNDPNKEARMRKKFYREALIWRQLKHPNIHPFLGLYERPGRMPCIVSPWQSQGNLIEFLKSPPGATCDLLKVLQDVTSALAYLHGLDPPLVHGDIKGANILIENPYRPKLADFGISNFIYQQLSKDADQSETSKSEIEKNRKVAVQGDRDTWKKKLKTLLSSKNVRTLTNTTSLFHGTLRWMSPEAMDGGYRMSTASDLYSFACLCLEIYTLKHPWREITNQWQIPDLVRSGKRPKRPKEVPKEIWTLVQKTWVQCSEERLTAREVYQSLGNLYRKMPTKERRRPSMLE